MKKLVLILIGIFCISVQLLYAEGEENLRYKSVTTYEKHDGRKNFWGQDRYADVSTTFDAYISTDLRWEIHRYHVTCKNPGYAKCRKTLEASIPEITTSGQVLPIEYIENIEDELLEKVEEAISNGEPDGLLSKKIIFNNFENPIVFFFSIVWNGCDENGNGNIMSQITDITNEIQNIYAY